MTPSARHQPRPRLREALLEADCRLRLLCAPAGSGKSVLLGECLEHCPADVRLVRLDLRGQVLGAEALRQRLASALGLPAAEALGEHLAAQRQALWLVLDDYSRFPALEQDRLLNELIQVSAACVRWWLASRRRPQLQLTRLLLDGELFELNGRELAFTPDELGQWLQRAGQAWLKPDIAELHRRSAGWCAGVRLRLLGLRPGQALAGDDDLPLVLDYLKREVLDELPGDWQLALFSLAHFPQFDHALCEQLLGAGEGGQLLAQLLECGLFIEPSAQDCQQYGVQPDLAPLLADQLPSSMAKALFRKACQWYLGREQLRAALECALRADQPEVAASLLQRYTEDQLLHGRGIARLLEWRRELPEEMLLGTPRLAMINAWASLLSGRLDEGRYYMDALERFLPQPDAVRQRELIAQCKALVGKLAYHKGEAERAALLVAEASEELPERAWSQRLLCQVMRVEQALIEGRFEDAQALNHSSIKLAREQGNLAFESLLALEYARLLEMRGELLRAESLLARLQTELAGAWGADASPVRGRTLLIWGGLLLQRGRYQEAEARFTAGMEECRVCADPASTWGHLGLAELDALQGDFDAAFTRIAEAERAMQLGRVDEQLYRSLLLATKARLWLAQGRHAQVERALSRELQMLGRLPPFGVPDLNLRLQLLLAQARLQGEARQAALEELQALSGQAQASGRRTLACEVAFCLAEGLYAEGRHGQAKQALLEALAQARQMGLASLERAFAQRNPALLRWAVEGEGGEGEPVALLSRRELDVLRLIARGLSNQQIAEELFISLHTVKTHAQRINFKLGVERRTQAVARAKELGLSD